MLKLQMEIFFKFLIRNFYYFSYTTPVYWACLYNKPKMLSFLLENKAKPSPEAPRVFIYLFIQLLHL